MFDHTKYRPFPTIQRPQRQWPNQTIDRAPQWCAVDLRDGNQALMEPMSVSQKQKIWALLVDMGFKHIEVGFPSASQTDFDFVRWLIEENQIPDDVTIQVLVQARDHLIERTYESLVGAKQAIVHVYNSTSPVQRNKVFNLDKDGIIKIAQSGAQKVMDEAKRYPETQWTFQYSPESFSSTEIDFAIEVCNAVIDVWQPTADNKAIINLPATVECAGPNVFADQVETFCEKVNHRNAIIVSVHTHNDRGCAVAAAEFAVMAGADRVEGTLMGNGERTGNMDIITMAMNLYSQGVDPEIDMSDAYKITKTVEECTGIATHARHPWMGELVYTAFSGSHQDAIKKCLSTQQEDQTWDVAYLPINPEDIGRDYQSVIRVNSQSGKGGIAYMVESQYGITLPRWMQIELSQVVQRYTEAHECEVNAQTIWQIFNDEFMDSSKKIQLVSFETSFAQGVESIEANIMNNQAIEHISGQGHGVLEAFCNGLSQSIGQSIEIKQFEQTATEQGANAHALTMMHVQIGTKKYISAAINEDSVQSGMMCILSAIDRFFITNTAAA
jgi:2-isopropylmalate synthase